MKWFKHMTDASEDEFLAALEAEFGLEGYARWWKMCEKIGKQMDETERCFADYPIEKWKGFLSEKREKNLIKFLEFCANFVGNSIENQQKISKLSYEINGKILRIKIPKLLKLRDEYSKKSGQTPKESRDNIPPKNQTSEIESDLDIKDQDSLKMKVDFDVDKFLSDTDRFCARAEAPGWDLHFLMREFNNWVKGKEIPKYPAKAFIKWCETFTKGKSP